MFQKLKDKLVTPVVDKAQSGIVSIITRYIAKKLEHKKALLAAIAVILTAIVGVIGSLFPDLGLPVIPFDQAWEMINEAIRGMQESPAEGG
jgi:hypothetical protein